MKKNRRKITAREYLRTPEGRKKQRERINPLVRSLTTVYKMEPPLLLSRRAPAIEPKRFIEYRDGDFYVKEKLVDFPDPDAAYVIFLRALYLKANSRGFVSYKIIDDFITKELGSRIENKNVKNKRIINALANLYRGRRRQRNPFPKRTPNGDPVIRGVPGKGFIFTNPTLR